MEERYSWINLITACIFSVFSCIFLYGIISPLIPFQKINDFYVGYSIFLDHNKIFDVSMFFVYVGLTFLFFFLINKICRCKKCRENKICDKEKVSFFIKLDFLENIKNFLLKFQVIGIFGYLLIHPYDGHFYPKITLITAVLMVLAIFDYIKRKNKSFSPLCTAPFFLIFVFSGYGNLTVPTDDYHLGEKFSTYYMHAKYSLQYYKDIALVHGFCDIAPSYIGHHFFDLNNMQGFLYGLAFEKNITMLLTFIIIAYAFSSPIFLVFSTFAFTLEDQLCTAYIVQTGLILSGFLLLLRNEIFKKPFLVSCLYIVLSFIFWSYYTSIGTFWIIGGSPLFVYMIFKIIKAEDRQKFLKLGLLVLIIGALITFNFDIIRNYHIQMAPYVKGNLIAFSNTFISPQDANFYEISRKLLSYAAKYFAMLIIPFFIYDLFKNQKDDKENPFKIKEAAAQKTFFLLFAIIIIFISVSYTLGRIDFSHVTRLNRISVVYLTVFLPYFLIGKMDYKVIKTSCIAAFIIGVIYSMPRIIDTISNIHFKPSDSKTILNGSNGVIFDEMHKSTLEVAKKFTDKYSENGDVFLDLNNKGMYYFYFDRKIPIMFTSFYNSIASSQDKNSMEKLKANPPKFILIFSAPVYHDELKASLRVNQTYKWILTSGLYSLKKESGQYGLFLNKKYSKYTKEELKALDNIFATRNIGYVSQVWGESVESLPLEEANIKYALNKNKNKISIVFDRPIKGVDFDLLYANIKNDKSEVWNIEINGSDFVMTMLNKTGKMLIPVNSVPSWLLNENIKEINIVFDCDNNLEDMEVKFYKRR